MWKHRWSLMWCSTFSTDRFSSWCAGTPAGSLLRLHPCLLPLSFPSDTQHKRRMIKRRPEEFKTNYFGSIRSKCCVYIMPNCSHDLWEWSWGLIWMSFCFFLHDGHYLQLFICEVLSQLFGYSLQILERDPARLVVIKQTEGFQDLLFGVLLSLKSEKKESQFSSNCISARVCTVVVGEQTQINTIQV